MFKPLLLFLIISAQLFADPWGKDADLAHPLPTQQPPTLCQTPLFGPLSEILINFHKKIISPADGPRSHYRPNSSQYALDAMRKYGFFKGFLLGCDRLMRENEEAWVYQITYDEKGNPFKFDPVR